MLVLVSIIGVIVIVISVSFLKHRKYQLQQNKHFTEALNESVQAFQGFSKELETMAYTIESLSKQSSFSYKQAELTRKICLEIISNHEKLSSAVKEVVKNSITTSDQVKRVTKALTDKIYADKKLMNSLKSFIKREGIDEEDEDIPKLLN